MGTNKITTSYVPVNGVDLTNKTYVDGAITTAGALYLPLAGGTMTGLLQIVGSQPISLPGLTSSRVLATNDGGYVATTAMTFNDASYLTGIKSNVQTQLDNKLNLSGGQLSGNLGIGTSPASTLHLYDTADPLITMSINTVDYSYISAYTDLFLGANVRSGGGGIKNGDRGTASIRLVPQAYDGGYMTFSTSDEVNEAPTERMRITKTGRVGINKTAPEGDLHVQLAGAVNDYWGKLVVKTTSFWGDGCSSRSETAGTQYATMFAMMFLNPHIVSDTDGWCRIRMGRSGGVATGRWWEMAVRADGNFQIGVEGNNQFEIDRRGYVGIGGVNTSYQLNVNGQARVTGLTTIGDIRLNPNAFGNGNQIIGTDSGHLILYPLTGKTAINLPSNASLAQTLEVGGNARMRGSLYADSDVVAAQVYTNDWFRINSNNSGLYWQNLGYGIVSPQQQGNPYGNVTTYGQGSSAWQGYGIRGRYCFMAYTYADDWGIHDNSYSWLIRGNGGSTRRVYMSGGVAMFAREWDRFVVWRTATEDDWGNGYFFVNQNWGYGYTSDARIKQDIESIPEDKSVAFIKNLQPSRFRARDSQPVKCKIGDEEKEITPQCCNCQTIDGFIAQNVLESAVKAQVSKSLVNHWYDYEEEMKKPAEEQQLTKENILGVNDTPILSHTVNVVKSLLDKVDILTQRNLILEQQARLQEQAFLDYKAQTEERFNKLAELIKSLK
jgi:hypothetical protein